MAYRSASRCSGALLLCAERTSSTMRAYWLSPAVAVARSTSGPSSTRLPLDSSVCADARAGIGSPVSRDVSTWALPSSTSPSTGTISPGRTSRQIAHHDAGDTGVLHRRVERRRTAGGDAVRDPRRFFLERAHRGRRAPLRVALERLASRLHEHDHEAGDRLHECDRRRDGERGDDVRREVAAQALAIVRQITGGRSARGRSSRRSSPRARRCVKRTSAPRPRNASASIGR